MLSARTVWMTVWLLVGFSAVFAEPEAQDERNNCVACHRELEDELQTPALIYAEDVHSEEGIACDDCHGGDPTQEDAEEAMNPARGFIGAPSTLQIPEFCGRCHADPAYMRRFNPSLPTDQLDKYKTSHHGELQKMGDTKAAQCVSCHGVHDIRKVNDPRSSVYSTNVPQTCARCHADTAYMASYDIPTNQYEGYRKSVHGIALLQRNDTGAPACNDCHGNHAATPPGITSISMVCYQCHLAEGELFNRSPHKAAFDKKGEPECSSCHGNHFIRALTDDQVGVDSKSLCVACHRESDAGYEAAKRMKAALVDLSRTYERSLSLITEAERKGVEVSDQRFELINVRNSLINIRKLVHAFDPDTLEITASAAKERADSVYQAGVAANIEVKNRRKGFLVFTGVSIVVLILLFMHIRRRESKDA